MLLKNTQNELNNHVLLDRISRAYKTGKIDDLMKAVSNYIEVKEKYIEELESKFKKENSLQYHPSSDVVKRWNEEVEPEKLSNNSLLVLDFIYEFISHNGYSPSFREICAGTGLASTQTVKSHVEKLDSHGYIIKMDKKQRSLVVNEEKYFLVKERLTLK